MFLTNTVGFVAFAANNTLESIVLFDNDGDGKMDRAQVTVDNDARFFSTIHSNTGWSVTYNGNAVDISDVGFPGAPDTLNNADPLVFNIDLDENDLAVDTAADNFQVTYTQQGVDQGSEYSDFTDAQLVAIVEGAIETDSAKPVVANFEFEGQTIFEDGDKTMKLTFSENLTVLPEVMTYIPNDDLILLFPRVVNDCGDADAKTACFIYPIPDDDTGTNGLEITDAADGSANIMDTDFGRLFGFDTVDSPGIPPIVTAVSSDGQIYITTGIKNITVTFNEAISNSPTIGIDGANKVITDCADGNDSTFCFDYDVPDQANATKTIDISDATNTFGTAMVPDSTHTFKINTIHYDGGGSGGGAPILPKNKNRNGGGAAPIQPVQPPGQPEPTPEETVKLTSEEELGLTRAEVVKIALDTFGIEIPEDYVVDAKPFSDIAVDYKYAKYIAVGKQHGIVRGYGPDFTQFKPDRTVSRAEALQIFFEAANLDTSKGSLADLNFLDIIYPNAWYIKYVVFAIKNNVLAGYNGEYKPDQSISEAELDAVIDAVLELQ